MREATRGEYLLDLVLSDTEGVKCKVIPKIADYGAVLVQYGLPVPGTVFKEREVWSYGKADWEGLRTQLATVDSNVLYSYSVDVAADLLARKILELAAQENTSREEVHPSVGEPTRD